MRARLLVGARDGAPCAAVLHPADRPYALGYGDGSVLFQNDHDLIHLADHLGSGHGCALCDPDSATVPADEAHGAAWDWLLAHDGEDFEDPGYLDGAP